MKASMEDMIEDEKAKNYVEERKDGLEAWEEIFEKEIIK